MGTLLLNEIKKQASSFLLDKYKSARLVFTDVSKAELLTEEATNGEPCSPDARTMTKVSEAAYDIDDFWRIIDVLHRRLFSNDWKQWRSTYKALVLLDFLLTHGPETVAKEFQSDVLIIKELGKFQHIDEKGFNWGDAMRMKSERILKLLQKEDLLYEERAAALKISKEIQGFGNLMINTSLSSPRTSSFGSCSSSSPRWSDFDEQESPTKNLPKESKGRSLPFSPTGKQNRGAHLWDTANQETGSLLDTMVDMKNENEHYYSKITASKNGSPRSTDCGKLQGFTHFGNIVRRKIDRHISMGI